MAASKRRTAKVRNMKSQKLDADQASQVKGGLLPAVRLTPGKWSPTALRLSPTAGISAKI
jgi:hypothetical protein